MAKSKKPPCPEYLELVERLLDEHPDLTTGSLFGVPCVKKNGKAPMAAYDGAAVFKLEGDPHTKALALDGSVLFDPSGSGRAMTAWVVVSVEHVEQWPEFADTALGLK